MSTRWKTASLCVLLSYIPFIIKTNKKKKICQVFGLYFMAKIKRRYSSSSFLIYNFTVTFVTGTQETWELPYTLYVSNKMFSILYDLTLWSFYVIFIHLNFKYYKYLPVSVNLRSESSNCKNGFYHP